jgi:hypothetical protein
MDNVEELLRQFRTHQKDKNSCPLPDVTPTPRPTDPKEEKCELPPMCFAPGKKPKLADSCFIS